jgi:hypothetical protein
MEIIAFILGLIAIFCFLLAAYGLPSSTPNVARAWHWGWLGLAFLTASWMVELIVQSGSHVTIH